MYRLVFLLCVSAVAGFGAAGSPEVNASTKRDRPPKPEADGLRLEVSARLDDSLASTGEGYFWTDAFLDVEVALHNVSPAPITVATAAYNEKPFAQNEPGLEYIVLMIAPDRFQGKPTAFVPARFTPVVLAPGESVLLFNHRVTIKDRKRADALREVSAAFVVVSAFNGPKEWWRGSLLTCATVRRGTPADQQIAESRAYQKKYDAQKDAEKDPNYGQTNAARVAALIAGADEASLRDKKEETKGQVIVRDPQWIRRVSAAIASTRLPRSGHCFCAGWRTAYFQKEGQFVISIAVIHGNQLRIHWSEGGGDYVVSEVDWKAIKEAMEVPIDAVRCEAGRSEG